MYELSWYKNEEDYSEGKETVTLSASTLEMLEEKIGAFERARIDGKYDDVEDEIEEPADFTSSVME